MDTNEKTPLWLDLRKEYIDDNFEKLLCYLKDCSLKKSQDAFYSTTINLLRERVGDLLSTLAVRPIYADEEDRRDGGAAHRPGNSQDERAPDHRPLEQFHLHHHGSTGRRSA